MSLRSQTVLLPYVGIIQIRFLRVETVYTAVAMYGYSSQPPSGSSPMLYILHDCPL